MRPDSPAAWQTYGLRQRPAEKARRASCAEVDCPNYLHGWRTVIDPAAAPAGAQLHYLRGDRTRRHAETTALDGRVVFEFEAGQTCFGEHWIEMQQLYLVRAGDQTTNLGMIRRHTRGDLWVEDFGENQQNIAERRARG